MSKRRGSKGSIKKVGSDFGLANRFIAAAREQSVDLDVYKKSKEYKEYLKQKELWPNLPDQVGALSGQSQF